MGAPLRVQRGSSSATPRFPDDVIGRLDCGFAGPWHGVTPGIGPRREDGTERIALAPADPCTHDLIDLARAVRGDAPLLLGADDALAQARVIEALDASAATSTTKGLT